MSPEKKIKFLRKEIQLHNHKYYVLNSPSISDFEFDQLYDELLRLEKQFRYLLEMTSPLLPMDLVCIGLLMK